MSQTSALFCLHGFLGEPRDWEIALPKAQWKTPIYKADWLLGEEFSEACDWKTLASSLNCWARKQSLWGAHRILVGYSMGGRAALHALLEDPSLWAGAVIISAHPGLNCPTERELRRANDQNWALRLKRLPPKGETASELLSSWDSQPVLGDEPNPLPRCALLEAPGKRQKIANALEKWSISNQEDLRNALATIQKPVLWLSGEKDSKYAKLAQECATLNSLFKCSLIPEAGHRAPWTANTSFQATLRDWLGQFENHNPN